MNHEIALDAMLTLARSIRISKSLYVPVPSGATREETAAVMEKAGKYACIALEFEEQGPAFHFRAYFEAWDFDRVVQEVTSAAISRRAAESQGPLRPESGTGS